MNPQELTAERMIHLLLAMLSLLRRVNEYEIHFCMTPENDKAFLIQPWNKKDDPELLMVLMCNLV